MSRTSKSLVFVIAMSLSLAGNLSQIHKAQDTQKPKKHFLQVIPNGRAQAGCLPVEVKSIGNYAPAPTGQEIIIMSYSLKPVTAIKLGWYVFEEPNEWSKIIRLACNSPLPDKIILSGKTDWIDLGHIYQGQTCVIGKAPIRFQYPDALQIIVNSPPLKIDDFKSLTLDGTVNTFKQDYTAMIAASEIRFSDGSTWKLKIETE